MGGCQFPSFHRRDRPAPQDRRGDRRSLEPRDRPLLTEINRGP
jgi:hypothetical protein